MTRPLYLFLAVLLGSLFVVSGATGQIVRVEIVERTSPALDGVAFGASGPYEQIAGRVYGEVDPLDPHNVLITDLSLAPVNARGKVEYATDFVLLKPVDMSRANGILRYLAPNRGWRIPGPDSVFLATGTVFLWGAWQGDVPEGSGRLTLDVPVATNPDGTPVTGPVLVEFVGRPGAPLPEMPLQGNAYNSGQKPYPPVHLDNAGAVLTRRIRQTDARVAGLPGPHGCLRDEGSTTTRRTQGVLLRRHPARHGTHHLEPGDYGVPGRSSIGV